MFPKNLGGEILIFAALGEVVEKEGVDHCFFVVSSLLHQHSHTLMEPLD